MIRRLTAPEPRRVQADALPVPEFAFRLLLRTAKIANAANLRTVDFRFRRLRRRRKKRASDDRRQKRRATQFPYFPHFLNHFPVIFSLFSLIRPLNQAEEPTAPPASRRRGKARPATAKSIRSTVRAKRRRQPSIIQPAALPNAFVDEVKPPRARPTESATQPISTGKAPPATVNRLTDGSKNAPVNEVERSRERPTGAMKPAARGSANPERRGRRQTSQSLTAS